MTNYNLWRKMARVILLVSDRLGISPKDASALFYSSQLCHDLHDERNMLHCMSDSYLADELIKVKSSNTH